MTGPEPGRGCSEEMFPELNIVKANMSRIQGLLDFSPLAVLIGPLRAAGGWQLPVLVALLLLSSLGAIFASHEARRHFEALERARLARDQLLEQRGRLLIERGAFSAYHRVDVIATEQLVMRSPGAEDTVLVRP